jgi:hypothetical protein
MQAAIIAVLGYFLSMWEKSAALTETKIDDAAVAVAKKLVASQAFIDLISGWLNPPKTDGHSAMPFPMTYQAAISFPDGHRLRDLIANLHIDTALIEKLWPILAQLLVSLFV